MSPYRFGLKFEGVVISFLRERDVKVSSALTQQRRNACSVAKRMFETFASLSLRKGSSPVSTENLNPQNTMDKK